MRISDWSSDVCSSDLLVAGDRVTTLATALKIPGGDNIADNFWRVGNLLANIDPEHGTILRVLRGTGHGMEEFQQHPATGQQLVRTSLPHWPEVRRVHKACGRMFAPVQYHYLHPARAAT